jgi:spore germination protein
MEDVVTQVLAGNTVLLLDGCASGILISSKLFPSRGVQEADQETAIRGPKDSFTESVRSNTALIRRRIRDSRLKVVQKTAGERSKTDVALMYMEDLVKPSLLKEVKRRLENVSMDGILDSGMLEQLMMEDWKTPFPCIQRTQRPDKTASALLEGRIVLVTDNSPDVLLLPASFHCFFQASDDYYTRWESATFARLLRYGAALLSIGFPAFYIAAIGFHTEVLPTNLILSIARARQGIPFPVVFEVILMELAFELLREAGIRLPGQLGATIGIVGGLIVGQAAVDAGIVSTIVVIVVALTAIASFSVPNETMSSAFRILKYFFIFMAALWGLYGFFLAWLFLIVHLSGLYSLGEPYLLDAAWRKGEGKEKYKDYYMRLPLFTMWKRPVYTRKGARIRRKKGERHEQ